MKQTIFRSLLIILGLLAVFIIGPRSASADTTYVPLTNLKVANYYTRIRSTSHDYGIYKSGGWKTSEDNLKPIAFGHEFKNKKIHVTKQETAGTGTWVKFTYQIFTGWIHIHAPINHIAG